MKHISYTLYNYNELGEEAKKVAVESYRTKYGDRLFDEIDGEMLKELMEEKLQEKGYPDVEALYSLSYSQGDGMRFETKKDQRIEATEMKRLVQRLLNEEEQKIFHKLVEEGYSVTLEIYGTTHHYYHYNTMGVIVESDAYYLDNEEVQKAGEAHLKAVTDVLDTLEERVREDVKECSRELERLGYDIIERHYEDENIADMLVNNEHMEIFNEDGTVD